MPFACIVEETALDRQAVGAIHRVKRSHKHERVSAYSAEIVRAEHFAPSLALSADQLRGIDLYESDRIEVSMD